MPTTEQRNRILQAAERVSELEQLESRIAELDRAIARETARKQDLETEHAQIVNAIDSDLLDLKRLP